MSTVRSEYVVSSEAAFDLYLSVMVIFMRLIIIVVL